MYKILDLFAGAGGLSLGFEMTKQFEVSAIVENNKNAAKTYIENHRGLTNYQDILTVDFNKIIEENGMIDVVIGGPPCQGFSNANRQRRNLINGSNELVKKYVQAIRELQPQVFVMENVKTIASDKHSFCLTYGDENYIRNKLRLNIHNTDVIIYEGTYINRLNVLMNNHQVDELSMVDENELYFLYNIYKKKGQLKKLFSNNTNIKKVNAIIDHMSEKNVLPDWYNEITVQARDALQKITKKHEYVDDEIGSIKRFWDVQRLFQGIIELNQKDAIFTTLFHNHQIILRMQTYIVIDFILAAFNDLNYVTNGNVLNAANFGVPQCRERYLLIGVKNNRIKNDTIELPKPIITNPGNYVTVKNAIEDLEKYAPTMENMDHIQKRQSNIVVNSFYKEIVFNSTTGEIFNHVCTDSSEKALERFKRIGPGKNFHSLPSEYKDTYENPERTQNTIYKRLLYDEASDTVVNVRKSMWIHPVLNRAISAREAARLQSFPDYYKFLGTKDSVYQQIGNAVPPMLGRAVAEQVLLLLNPNLKYEKLQDIYIKYIEK